MIPPTAILLLERFLRFLRNKTLVMWIPAWTPSLCTHCILGKADAAVGVTVVIAADPPSTAVSTALLSCSDVGKLVLFLIL